MSKYWDFYYCDGRFEIVSTILATEKEIEEKIGKTVYWHDLDGKHSEGEFVLSKDMFTPAKIAEYGFNPLEEVMEYEEELSAEGEIAAPEPQKPTQDELDLREMQARYPVYFNDLCNKLPNREAKEQACDRLYDDLGDIYKKYADVNLDRYFYGKSITLGVYYKYGEHAGREEEFVRITKGLPTHGMTVKERYAMRAMKSYMQFSSVGAKI